MKNRIGVVSLCLAHTLLCAAPTHAASYSPGDQWERANQFGMPQLFEPGKNYLRGNPWVDNQNNFVWSYEYAVSNGVDGLGGEPVPVTPWFRRGQPQLLVWDDEFRGGTGAWVVDDDTPCIVEPESLVHEWGAESAGAWQHVPVVRWRNPLNDGRTFSITGQLVVAWEGGVSGEGELVDIVVLHDKRRGPNDPVVPIFSATLNRADGELQTLAVDITDFEPQNSESLLISVKARVSGPSLAPVARVTVFDELVITLEEAPSGYCPEDFNRDGQIDFADLNRILHLFGTACDELD